MTQDKGHRARFATLAVVLIELNSELVPHDQARVSVFDRGFLFGDGMYEGLRSFMHGGRPRLIAGALHVARLQAGLREAGIEYDAGRLLESTDRVLDANGLTDAFVYWQVTRGTPSLDDGPVRSRVGTHGYPPTSLVYATPLPSLDVAGEPHVATKRVSLQRDDRWSRGHMKSISLLGNVLAAIAGVRAQGEDGAGETLLYRETPEGSLLAEGTYTNVLVALDRAGRTPGRTAGGPKGGKRSAGDVLDDVELVTPSLRGTPILNGVTRAVVLKIEPRVVERVVTLAELRRAREVMLLGTTTMVTRVVQIDGVPVGPESNGPIATALQRRLLDCLNRGEDAAIDPGTVSWAPG